MCVTLALVVAHSLSWHLDPVQISSCLLYFNRPLICLRFVRLIISNLLSRIDNNKDVYELYYNQNNDIYGN